MRHIRHTSSLFSGSFYSIMTVLLCAALFAGCTGHRFTISFDQVNGLKQKDPVIFEGKAVGQVKKITYTQDAKFQVAVEIAEAFSDHATEDSRFFIGNAPGDTGTKAVIIEQSRAGGKKIPAGAVVDGSTKSPAETAAASLEEMWQTMEKKMADLMEQLETIPETEEYQAMKDAMAELEQKLKSSGQKMGDTLKNDILPLLEEKIKALSDSLRQQGKENQAEELEKDFGRLQKI
ncbi:MAG: MlaD family protein [Desulfotignum sp.]